MTTRILVAALGIVGLLGGQTGVAAARQADPDGAARQAGPTPIAAGIHRDVALPAGDSAGAVVVLSGDALVAGVADFVLVVGGTARLLPTATVGTVWAVNGVAELHGGAFVAHDVLLVDGRLALDPGAVIGGEVAHGYWNRMARGVRLFGILIGIGISLALLLGALIAVAIAPDAMRRASVELTDRLGLTLVATVLLWLAAPWLALYLVVTVVGIPIGLGFWIFVLPALGFAGYLVSAETLGRALVSRARDGFETEHPYLTATCGVSALLVVGLLPVLGAIVSVTAATVGAGAVVVAALRGTRRRRRAAAPAGDGEAALQPTPL